MRKCAIIILFSCIHLVLFAQEKLIFNGTEFDFGQVGQVEIPFEHDFIFRNTSFSPVTILAVRSIHPSLKFIHTKSDVFTGEYGFVKVKLYTDSLDGLLNEEIYLTIRIGEEVKSKVLYIRANVSSDGRKENDRAFNDTKIATSVEVSPEDIETMEGFFGKDRLTQVESELKYLRKQIDLKSELIAQLSQDLQKKKTTEAENLKQLNELQQTLANPSKVDQSAALAQLNNLTKKLQDIQRADEAMRNSIKQQETLYERAQFEADSARAYAASLSDKLQKQFEAEAKAIEKANKLEASLQLKQLTEDQQKRQIDSLEKLIAIENDDRELQNEIEKLKSQLTWKQQEQQLQTEHAQKQQSRIDELKFQKEQIEQLSDSLTEHLSLRTTENQELQKRLYSTNGRISAYELKIDSLNRLNSTVLESKKNSRSELDSLNAQLASIKNADQQLKETIETKEAEMSQLLANKSLTEKNLKALEVATTSQVEEAQKLMYRINSLSQRESKSRLEVTDLQQKLTNSREREDSARVAVLNLLNNIETKNQSLNILEQHLSEKELQLLAMRNEETWLRKSLNDAESKNMVTQLQIDSLATAAERADKKEVLLQQDISRLQIQILTSHNQAKESEAHANELEGKLENATLSNKLAFEELKDEVTEMRTERDNFKTQYQSSLIEMEALRRELEARKLSEENAIAFASEFGYSQNTAANSNTIEYVVVIVASASQQPNGANFYSLGNVSQEQKNGRFVYSIKGLSTLDSADQLKQKAKAKGYPLAHVIAFKNGIQISLKEAAETAMH
ncbi:MAG: DUF1573 domain-containing protein [Salibacteraceae bacterium]|nr:DUF1573 domain-containing protein [Salibacteraceae bacterium]